MTETTLIHDYGGRPRIFDERDRETRETKESQIRLEKVRNVGPNVSFESRCSVKFLLVPLNDVASTPRCNFQC